MRRPCVADGTVTGTIHAWSLPFADESDAVGPATGGKTAARQSGAGMTLPARREIPASRVPWSERPNAAGAALGPHNNEKRRLTLEDVERRFRRSAAVFGNYW